MIAYLRLIANSDDDPAFIRAVTTPKRGIGAATLEKLGQVAATLHVSLFEAVFSAAAASQIGERHLAPLVEFCNFINRFEERVVREPAGEVLNDLLKSIDYEVYVFDQDDTRAAQSKWNNVLEFAAWIAKKGEEDDKNLLQLTQTIALITLLEGREEEEPDVVRLSTLHAAKGLEFGHVFLVGVEENILPHRDAVDEGRLEEERRLMYVGVTRAKKSLTLSYCARRKRARESVACDPSRFIDELGDDVRRPGEADRCRRQGQRQRSPGRVEGDARLGFALVVRAYSARTLDHPLRGSASTSTTSAHPSAQSFAAASGFSPTCP